MRFRFIDAERAGLAMPIFRLCRLLQVGGWRRRYPGGSAMQQYLGNRLAETEVDPELARREMGFPSAQTLTMTRQSHSSIKICSLRTSPTFHQVNPDKGYRRSHIGPPPQPDKPAASLGDYCSAVLSDRLDPS